MSVQSRPYLLLEDLHPLPETRGTRLLAVVGFRLDVLDLERHGGGGEGERYGHGQVALVYKSRGVAMCDALGDKFG